MNTPNFTLPGQGLNITLPTGKAFTVLASVFTVGLGAHHGGRVGDRPGRLCPGGKGICEFFSRSQHEVTMKKRYRQQQTVESDRAPYPSVRSQQDASPVRLSISLGIIFLGLLIVGGAVLGILSLADVIRGHPGESWQHLTAWIDSIKGWLLRKLRSGDPGWADPCLSASRQLPNRQRGDQPQASPGFHGAHECPRC
jgi:hypothetical protein